ncbi:MAG: TetR/AcrR family transcriptional regulator [Sandaracinaceae bacterium]|nr:TetR/AcrR family transcriptional regulator [Sandaracinaceae bacterium]
MQPAIAEGTGAARLVEGLAAAVAEKGYAATTIADIVRHARVSKRTFYEHFPDKERCFLAAYQEASARTLAAIAEAVDPSRPFEEQIRAAMRACLGALEENVTMTRTFLLRDPRGRRAGARAPPRHPPALRRSAPQPRGGRAGPEPRARHAQPRHGPRRRGRHQRAGARGPRGRAPFVTVERTATELVRSVLTASR